MKIKHVLSLTSLAVCAALSTSAMAQNQVHFEGRVATTVCSATVNGGSNLVNIPSVALSTLQTAQAAGDGAGMVSFRVELTGCDQDGNYQVNFSQTGATAAGQLANTYTGTDKAQDVVLQLLSLGDVGATPLWVTPYPSSAPSAPADDHGIDVTAGAGFGTYFVEYFATSANATIGQVHATALMTLNFL